MGARYLGGITPSLGACGRIGGDTVTHHDKAGHGEG